ncbi:MAG: hypothetical protein K0U86_11750 [Planctomycetes bacterium]|nr:hypothetical protein [Planctomycetota bacterium]MCH9777611.1 hypothetical protein [Planctomycetota bacterium]MCH9790806.1 hypothetical protein [Planctomycetota bacterium]
MELLLFHPKVAFRDCEHCLDFVYNEETGQTRVTSRGECCKRLPTVPAPCRTSKGCPKGTPENQNVLSEKNMRAYQHWKECKAIGQFPDDPTVRRNAVIIQELTDIAAEQRQFQVMSAMMGGR